MEVRDLVEEVRSTVETAHIRRLNSRKVLRRLNFRRRWLTTFSLSNPTAVQLT